jgi:hypothetical protein
MFMLLDSELTFCVAAPRMHEFIKMRGLKTRFEIHSLKLIKLFYSSSNLSSFVIPFYRDITPYFPP